MKDGKDGTLIKDYINIYEHVFLKINGYKVVKYLSNDKATGSSGISNEMIKHLSKDMVHLILII